jgi:hypothetical protein
VNFKYEHPLVIQSGPQELKITKITTGTTTVELSDGRMLWLTIGVESVSPNAIDKNAVDIKHSITVEMMTKPEFPVADGTRTIQ